MDEANGKMRSKHENVDAASLGADILNPFVHRLELDTTYDKLKVSSSPNLKRIRKFSLGIDAHAARLVLRVDEGGALRVAAWQAGNLTAKESTTFRLSPPASSGSQPYRYR